MFRSQTTPSGVTDSSAARHSRAEANVRTVQPPAFRKIAVECVLGRVDRDGVFRAELALRFAGGDGAVFEQQIEPLPGLQHYRVRAYPAHALLAHPFEVGCMTWL